MACAVCAELACINTFATQRLMNLMCGVVLFWGFSRLDGRVDSRHHHLPCGANIDCAPNDEGALGDPPQKIDTCTSPIPIRACRVIWSVTMRPCLCAGLRACFVG